MLSFFRKYQKIFFVVVTVVIVVTFSFFGTYKAASGTYADKSTAFVAVNGKKIPQDEFQNLVRFISTDVHDRAFSQHSWGVNGFNDGVIIKDFIDTGLAEMIIKEYSSEIVKDWEPKIAKERAYKPYYHPAAPFISSVNVWNIFAPNLYKVLTVFQGEENIISNDSIRARLTLFLSEKMFTPDRLRQALLAYENQFQRLPHDNNIDHIDLSLFGYHSIKDWFGPRFVDIVGQFIINSSIIAEKKGYQVSKEEVIADLMLNNDRYLKTIYSEEQLKSVDRDDFLSKQLSVIGTDLAGVAKMWRQVMLFRRILQDGGESVIVDDLPYRKFHEYAAETYAVDIYNMHPDFQFDNFKDLQRFEIYMQALTQKSNTPEFKLDIPSDILPINQIKKNYPELFQKRYLVEIASVYKHDLEKKIGVKDLLDWQLADENWNAMVKSFPVLAAKSSATASQRFKILESLATVMREQVDQYAQNKILGQHPEWLDNMLSSAEPKLQLLSVNMYNDSIKSDHRKKFIDTLDRAALKGEESSDKNAIEARKSLQKFTADGDLYYRISVVNRSHEKELIAYDKAVKDGVLDTLLERRLKQYYYDNRYKDSAKYKDDSGEWLDFEKVQGIVAEDMFKPLFDMIYKDSLDAGDKLEYAVKHRAEEYLNNIRENLMADINVESSLINLHPDISKNDGSRHVDSVKDLICQWEVENYEDNDGLQSQEDFERLLITLPQSKNIKDQWKPIKNRCYIKRGDDKILNSENVFDLGVGNYSEVIENSSGQPAFFMVAEVVKTKNGYESIASMGHHIIAQDAKRFIARQLLHEIKDSNSINISYFNTIGE